MPVDEIGDEAETEARQQAIYKVAKSRSDAREEAGPASFAEGALYYEHTYRTHRGRYQQAYGNAAWQYVKQLLHLRKIKQKY